MYTIGIAGGSCSGKTTLTGALERRFKDGGLNTSVIHMDSFFKNPPPRTVAPFTGIEYKDCNHPNSFRLDDFYAAIDNAKASAVDIVIVEGLLVLWLDEARQRLDLRIFVDLASDERLYRRIKRFMRDTNETIDEIASRYLDTVRFRYDEFIEPSRWYADLVINGSADTNRSSEIVYRYVNGEIRGK